MTTITKPTAIVPECEHPYVKVRADYIIICAECGVELGEWKDVEIPEGTIGNTEEF